MWLKYPMAILLFFILTLLQVSFLPQLGLIAPLLNPVFVIFFVACFFEEKNQYHQGVFLSLVTGIILDIFSPYQFGFSVISLLIIYGVIKIAMHFITETKDIYLLFRFMLVFVCTLFLYNELMNTFVYFPRISFIFDSDVLIGITINLTLAIVAFFVYMKFIRTDNRQLKLF